MERSEKIVYHATNAYIHLQELVAMKLPCVSSMSQAIMEDTVQMLDGLTKMHSTKTNEGRSEG